MKINFLPVKEILDFEKEIGFELVVNERPAHYGIERFYVSFKQGEIMEHGCLCGYTGNGHTIDAALADYCKDISNKKMTFNAYKLERKEINIPTLTHTKLLGK